MFFFLGDEDGIQGLVHVYDECGVQELMFSKLLPAELQPSSLSASAFQVMSKKQLPSPGAASLQGLRSTPTLRLISGIKLFYPHQKSFNKMSY